MNVVLAYAALAIVATYPLILHPGSTIPGYGDAYQFYWNLWWVKRALVDLHANPYVTHDLFAPYGATLYFHTLNLLQDVIAIPITIALGLTAAYNSIVLLSFVVTGYGTFRLTLYVLEHELDAGATTDPRTLRLAAFLAGAAFAFSSYRFVHLLGHLDLLSTQWIPLFILFLLRTRREAGWSNPVWCGVFLAATALTSWYYAAYVLVFTALFLLWVVASRDATRRDQMLRLGVAFAVFLLAMSPLLVTMLSRGTIEGRTSNPEYDVDRFSADLIAFFVPSPLHPVWGRWLGPAYRAMDRRGASLEAVTFLGYVPLALAILGAATRAFRSRQFWMACAAVFGALALGPVLHIAGRALPALSILMPYHWFAMLPYADIPRVPSRFVVMAMMGLTPLAAAGSLTLLRRANAVAGMPLTIALTALIICENAIWPAPVTGVAVPPLFRRLATKTRAPILEVPIPDDPAVFPFRMLWQTVHGQPVFGGYLSRNRPPLAFEAIPGFAQFKSLTDSMDDVVDYDRAQLPALGRAILAVHGAGHVVIERRLMSPGDGERARAIAEQLLGASALKSEDDFTLDYAVSQPHEQIAPAVWLETGWSYLERRQEQDSSGRALRWRWMSDRATLGLVASEAARVHLELTLQAFNRPRRMRISVDGSEIATLLIATDRVVYDIPSFAVIGGSRVIELTSLDGADTPGADVRRLSVALFHAELLTGP